MSSDVAIRASGLGKAYRIVRQERQVTLTEQMLHRLRRPLSRPPSEAFWALSDVNLEVRRGEVLGLIGRNGAGKSTLLKVLSRITPPTKGRVDVFGRVGSLLEVGTGFHPELTGRENVYLNGSILGMRKAEIDRQFDAIVEFAGVERFLDTPVKRYSSGMFVRLAFAVAAHLETEILLVDEVLAVGDQEFQDKCIGKMRDVTTDGRTVILVSHNLDSIQQLAHRCVLLDVGEVVTAGRPAEVLHQYQELTSRGWRKRETEFSAPRRMAEITSVQLSATPELASGEPLRFRVGINIHLSNAICFSVGLVVRKLGRPIGADTIMLPIDFPMSHNREVAIALNTGGLAPGVYTLTLGVGAWRQHEPVDAHDHDVIDDVLSFSLGTNPEADWLDRHWKDDFGHVRLSMSASEIETPQAPPRPDAHLVRAKDFYE